MPSPIDERQVIVDRIAAPIQDGKPELGWSGDKSLVLTFHRIEQRWELFRHEPAEGLPDRYVPIAKGPVGGELNEAAINHLIMGLVDRDSHREGNSASDQLERILKENDRLEEERLDTAVDVTFDALANFYTEAGKELGVHQTTWAI